MVDKISTRKVIGSCQPQHRGRVGQFSLKQLEKSMPPDLEIHLIEHSIYEWLGPLE